MRGRLCSSSQTFNRGNGETQDNGLLNNQRGALGFAFSRREALGDERGAQNGAQSDELRRSATEKTGGSATRYGFGREEEGSRRFDRDRAREGMSLALEGVPWSGLTFTIDEPLGAPCLWACSWPSASCHLGGRLRLHPELPTTDGSSTRVRERPRRHLSEGPRVPSRTARAGRRRHPSPTRTIIRFTSMAIMTWWRSMIFRRSSTGLPRFQSLYGSARIRRIRITLSGTEWTPAVRMSPVGATTRAAG